MRVLIGTAALALGVIAPTAAVAQNACEQFLTAPPVGSWVEYEFAGQGQAGRSRMAVVGSEQRDGRDLTWYEMSFSSGGQQMIAKMLAEGGFYHAMAEKKVEEMIVKLGDQPAMKFSGAMMQQIQGRMGTDPASQFGNGCENAERVGPESITVLAGTFDAIHYRLTTGPNPGDAWIVEGLPFGMVKWTGSMGESAEMVARGDDAEAELTEEPMVMPG